MDFLLQINASSIGSVFPESDFFGEAIFVLFLCHLQTAENFDLSAFSCVVLYPLRTRFVIEFLAQVPFSFCCRTLRSSRSRS